MMRQLAPQLAATSSQAAVAAAAAGDSDGLDHDDVIDLSNADNTLLRDEMREIVQDAISSKQTWENVGTYLPYFVIDFSLCVLSRPGCDTIVMYHGMLTHVPGELQFSAPFSPYRLWW